jgi:lipid II:glycine glycyltransferase (peptidoglycan interpeptide bridge formation enzyme)
MNYKLEIIDPASYPDWNDLVLSTPDYSVFHSTEWANVIHSTYKYQPLYFVYKDSEEVNALIPSMIVNSFITGKRIVSLPFSDYCAPLLVNNKLVLEDLFNKILAYLKSQKFSSIEIRGGNNFFKNVDSPNYFYLHRLELNKSDEELFAGFSGGTKRNIKKAVREGIIVRIEDTMEAAKGFYSMNCITRRYHGLPPQPRLFFENIFSEFISKKRFCD